MSERRAPGIDEFFIGWLAMPTGYARLLRVVTPALLLAAAGVAAILPLWQQSPGTGAWDSDEVVTVEGILQAEPYAMLHGASLERTILLVEAGKFGAASRAMLCISGGIPPMLAVRQNDRETFYLLTLADGSAANAHVLPFVGDLVEVQGERTLVGELPVLRMSNIHRR
jgi:hypothetical protein